MKVLAISYGRNLFTADNPERARMLECASVVDELHIIVFARSRENLADVNDAHLFLYATGGRTKIGMVARGFLLGRKILKKSDSVNNFVITTQDPFEAGLVGYLLSRVFGIQINIQEHGDFFSTRHWKAESPLNSVRFYFGLWLLRRVDTVRVVSNRIKETLVTKGVEASKIRLLSVSVPLQTFLHAQPNTSLRDLFPPQSIIVVSVGRFVLQKNLPMLVTAFARAYAHTNQLRLVLVGKGPEQTKLEKMVAVLFLNNNTDEIVKIIPWTDNVPQIMASSDIYALSSNYEGYARVLPEAMAVGLPTVATDVGCAGSVLISNKEGFVVPVGDEEAFSQALIALVSDIDMRRQFGDAGRRTAQDLIQSAVPYEQSWVSSLT